MNLEQRLAELEKHFHGGGSFRLEMPDGSIQLLPLKPGQNKLDFYIALLRDRHSPEAELIRQCARISDPVEDAGLMGELCKSMLDSPDDPLAAGDESEGLELNQNLEGETIQ